MEFVQTRGKSKHLVTKTALHAWREHAHSIYIYIYKHIWVVSVVNVVIYSIHGVSRVCLVTFTNQLMYRIYIYILGGLLYRMFTYKPQPSKRNVIFSSLPPCHTLLALLHDAMPSHSMFFFKTFASIDLVGGLPPCPVSGKSANNLGGCVLLRNAL